MSWQAFRLHEVHKRLDDEIRREQRKQFTNSFRIMRLKKLKLAIKDRLAMIMRRPAKG